MRRVKVASEAAMLKLSAEVYDVVRRTDESRYYELFGENPSDASDWMVITDKETIKDFEYEDGYGEDGKPTYQVPDIDTSKVTKSSIQIILEESMESLIKFSDYFFPHHKMDPVTGKMIPPATIHYEFEELLRGSVGYAKNKGFYNLLAILPRGCAKSTYAGVFFLIWCLIFTNKRYIIFVGATSDSIKDHFATIKEEIKRNKMLNLVGVRPLEKGDDNRVSFDVIGPAIPGFEKQYSGTDGMKTVRIEAYTASSFPRGKKRGFSRPDLIVIDDLERKGAGTQPGVESKAYRAKILDLFEASITPSGFNAKSMQIILLGTIMHEAQLLYQSYLQAQNGTLFPEFKSIKYSLIENYGTPQAYSIWPEKVTVGDFNLMMESAKHKGTTNIICNEYLSLPTAPDDEIFKRSDFNYFIKRADKLYIVDVDGNELENEKVVSLRQTSIVVTVDLAFTTEDRSDYTAFAISAVDMYENAYILDIKYGRWDMAETIEKAREILAEYNPIAFGVEDASGGKYMIQAMHKELFGCKNYVEVVPLSPGGLKKQDRIIQSLSIPYKDGRMYHRLGAGYTSVYEEQLIGVSKDGIKSKHDDLVDAASYLYKITEFGAIYNDDEGEMYDDYEQPGNSY